jgi:nucleotide-binding universal stress UspA family protein
MPGPGATPIMHDMERILIATDGSPSATEAVTVGIDLAAEQAAAVTFVHVANAALLPTRDDVVALTAAAELARETGVDADGVVVSRSRIHI